MNNTFEPEDLTGMYDTADIQSNKIISIIAYIPLLFIITLLAGGNSPYAKFHANQGLILTILAFVGAIVTALFDFIIGWIPLLGWLLTFIVTAALSLSVLGLMIIGIINTASSKAKKLPIIGGFAEIIK